jgi:L-asparaginase
VVVVGLGGTIAMTPGGGGGAAPALSAEHLVAAVPGLADTGVAVRAADFRRVPSASLGFGDLDALCGLLDELFAEGADGVVVAQGTDTVEETAYLLDLRHRRPQPLVVTGAMRHAALAGADGPGNLLAAITTAADPAARDRGCLVVLADEIHAADRVRKTHTTSTGAFRSPDGGPVGQVVAGRARFAHSPGPRVTVAPGGAPARVGLVTVVLGDDGALLDGAAERFDGLVVAAFGVGHVPAGLVGTLQELARRIPVVLASRAGAGPVHTDTYAYPGSESDLLARGLVPAGYLAPVKARVLLRALLAAGTDRAGIGEVFARAGAL